MADVEHEIAVIVAGVARVEPTRVGRDVHLRELGLGSLDIVEIIFHIEDRLQIKIPYNANETGRVADAAFRTIGDVVDAISALVAERDAAAQPTS
jgi:acyl carrier protein